MGLKTGRQALSLRTKNFLSWLQDQREYLYHLRILHNEEVMQTTSSWTVAGEVTNQGEEMGAAAPPRLGLHMGARLPSDAAPRVAHGEWGYPTKRAHVLDARG